MIDTMNKTLSVLLVDDDDDFLLQQEIRFRNAGFEVRKAVDTQQAMAEIAKARPDVAVVDLMLEHVDSGFTLCHQIKKADPTIPVILVSSVASETGLEFDAATDEERSWVKADVMLAKPIRFEQLYREVERLLKQ